MNPTLQAVIAEAEKAVIGKRNTLLWVLLAMLANGHILLEDIPGVGKTTMALAFCRAMHLEYGRVQFTPDVLPSDITGYSLYQKETGQIEYQPGAILCNLFLADELNRATSRTQSALLEAMEEGQVTVDGISHPLPRPFCVIATQNPTGAAGTQRLPDSQIDRFMIRLSIGYPRPEDEAEMILRHQEGKPLNRVAQIMSGADLCRMQEECARVYMNRDIANYIVALICATRNSPYLSRGASPRATLGVMAMAKAYAYLSDRDYVIPSDVRTIFITTVFHRLILTPEAEHAGKTTQDVANEILASVEAPSAGSAASLKNMARRHEAESI
ncbi:MAG: MoxR family ATPase [Clostridia bacterium]|nr:MoxR family ATPase [Clostridia bacterium]